MENEKKEKKGLHLPSVSQLLLDACDFLLQSKRKRKRETEGERAD